MIVYEVTLAIDGDIADAYRAWLVEHVAQILALPGFVDARILEVLESGGEPAPAPGDIALCVQYTLRDRAALEAYLTDHAARMRAQGEAHFGGRFRASRRVMAPVQSR